MDYANIFAEFWGQFRGQVESIPVFGDREYNAGIYRANTAIRKWDRVDGTLWKELYDSASLQGTTIFPLANQTIVDGTVNYPAPTNMRKTPAKVYFYTGSDFKELRVVDAKDLTGLNQITSFVTFTGSANKGYTMRISADISRDYAGRLVDYLYIKKPTFFTTATDPTEIPEMSDPNFLVQSMLAGAFANARNGFGYKVADRDAGIALMNMKIENSSGTFNSTPAFRGDTGWGVNNINQIKGIL